MIAHRAPVTASWATSGPRRAGRALLGQIPGELLDRLGHAPDHARPDLPKVDERDPQQRLVLDEVFDERDHRPVDAVLPVRRLLEGTPDGVERFADEFVEHGEEALFLVGELLVEGLRGHARELRDLRVGQPRVALVECQMDDRAEDTGALVVAREERGRRRRLVRRRRRHGHAQARGGGDAVGLDPIEHFVGQRVQLALAVLEHAHEHDLPHAAHDPARCEPREADAVGRHLEGAGDKPLEREAGELHALPGLRADPERVDEHQVRSLGLLGEVVKQRLAARVQPVGPAALSSPRVEHALARARDDDVVCGQEALLLVREELIERPARHAGQSNDVRHGRSLVAALGDRLDHPAVEARPLVAGHLIALHTARSVRQPTI